MDLLDLLGPGRRCLDIGAGTGRATAHLAGLVGPTGAVHAVEPRPGPRALLRARTATRRQVRVVAGRVGAHDDPWRAVHSVDGWRLRTGPVALLRIVGAVPAVLAGASRTLDRDRPALLIVVDAGRLVREGQHPDDVTGALRAAGYRLSAWCGTGESAGDPVRTGLFTVATAPLRRVTV